VTFGAADWHEPVNIEIAVDSDFVATAGSRFDKLFPQEAHTTGRIQGPLVIEGGTTAKDRSLKTAVMLPYEMPAAPKDVAVITDETQQLDSLVVFNDSSLSDDTGSMTTSNISGLDMTTADVLVPGENGDPDITVKAGINYAGVETVEVLLGSGNDQFNIDVTPVSYTGSVNFTHDTTSGINRIQLLDGSRWFDEGFRAGDSIVISGTGVNDGNYSISAISLDGKELILAASPAFTEGEMIATSTLRAPITVVHGGGNSIDGTTGLMGGDHLTVTGGGIASAPLLLFGDTSQDGSRYAVPTGTASEKAVSYDNYGDDLIDASAATVGITVYGGKGNDIIYGSQGDDRLAGGSGADRIYGEGGDDHIYGDTGINVDLTQRLSMASQVLDMVTIADAPTDGVNADDLTVAVDQLFGNAGADTIFGDHGAVTVGLQQLPDDLYILNNHSVTKVGTALPGIGEGDMIEGGAGGDLIFGSKGSDQLFGNDGDDHIIGDAGFASFNDASVITVVRSSDYAIGDDDTIDGGSGQNYILAGYGADFVNDATDSGDDWVVGDNGEFIFSEGVLTQVATLAAAIGDVDTINVGEGQNTVLGGAAGDIINSGSGDDHIMGDAGYFRYSPAGDLTEAVSTDHGVGGDDIINAGDGDNLVLAGAGGDDVTTGVGNDVVIGDNGKVTFVSGIRSRVEATDSSNTTGGDDTLNLDGGDDQAIAGVGKDRVETTSGENVLLGDNGYIVSDASGRYVEARTGNTSIGDDDYMVGGLDRDILFGGAGGDYLDGDGGDDMIMGDGAQIFRNRNNVILGTVDHFVGGDDTLIGGDGLDRMMGAFGGDLFYGSFTDDVMIGEYGRYTFILEPKTEAEKATFVITLGQGSLDLIRLSQLQLYTAGAFETLFPWLGVPVLTASSYPGLGSSSRIEVGARDEGRPFGHGESSLNAADLINTLPPTAAGTEDETECQPVEGSEQLLDAEGVPLPPCVQEEDVPVEGGQKVVPLQQDEELNKKSPGRDLEQKKEDGKPLDPVIDNGAIEAAVVGMVGWGAAKGHGHKERETGAYGLNRNGFGKVAQRLAAKRFTKWGEVSRDL